MTTIAFKDGVMAADSMQSGDFIDPVECKKILKIKVYNNVIPTDVLVGCAGQVSALSAFIAWYKECKKPEKWPAGFEEGFSALVYHNSELLYYGGSYGYGIDVGKFSAIGTGSEIAMGAMMAGASAVEAVEIACDLDTGSRKPVSWGEI